MADSDGHSPLRAAREHIGLARETVCRELDPPVSAKTLERWEGNPAPLLRKRWRVIQLARIYSVDPSQLILTKEAA